MRRLSQLLASALVASSLVGLLGCQALKEKLMAAGDAGGDDLALADAATVDVADTGAKNEKDVLRYAKEEPLDEIAVIGKDGTKARNFPGNGPEVATLPKGTAVMKMAKYFSTGVLVMFDDPSADDDSKLMGWVPVDAFDVAAPKPAWKPPKTVPKTVDAGGGAKPAATDAGTLPPKDAGAVPAAVDAGKAADKDADKTDKGGAIPQPAPGKVAVQPIDGKCPDNWHVHQSMCRRICSADAECPRGTKCKPGSGKKVCTAD